MKYLQRKLFFDSFVIILFIVFINCESYDLEKLESEFTELKKLKEVVKNLQKYKVNSWLKMLENKLEDMGKISGELSFTYMTNITDYNAKMKNDFSIKYSEFMKPIEKKAAKFYEIFKDSKNESLVDILKGLKTSSSFKDLSKTKKLNELMSEAEGIYGKGKVIIGGKALNLEPELTEILEKSTNTKLLETVWVEWRNSVGRKIKKIYPKIIDLLKEQMSENGNNDYLTTFLKDNYNDNGTIEQESYKLYDDLEPLYKKLHAYVRYKLHAIYGDYVEPKKEIKANLLGNMWAQQWDAINDKLVPYPELLKKFDLTKNLKEQNFTALKIFKTAEDFFVSIGLSPMTDKFWKKSMITKPTDGREVVCHASAWDISSKDNDYRIKMCTAVGAVDFSTVHHEMGHVEYYMAYANLSPFYRSGANPAFHEAVGDTIALSVKNSAHLQRIGLFDSFENSEENEKHQINSLLTTALEKVTVVAWSTVINRWWWGVMSGKIKPSEYNSKWWELRMKYQGIKSPVPRNDELDMDPAAKYHIASFTPYLRYLFSFVGQFQFYEALCKEISFEGPLHLCDYYKSKKAGKKLRTMLEKGSSIDWQILMKDFVGIDKFDAGAEYRYFKPLEVFLDKFIRENNVPVGW